MPEITADSLVSRNSDILTAEVGGELVLMSVARWHYFGLDPIGTDIWKRLEKRQTVGELCAALADTYEGDQATIQRDVIEFLSGLAGKDLLELFA